MRGFVTKKRNKWYPVIYKGVDLSTGKKKYKWYSGYDKKKDAEKELSKLVTEHNSSNLIDIGDMTLKELGDQWFELYAKEKLADRTIERYECILYSSIIPALGIAKLDQLNTLHIQRYIQTLKGKAPSTIKKHYYVLKSMLDQAVKWQLIARNPADGVVTPAVRRTEMQTWETDQAKAFLSIVEDTKWHIPFLLAFTAGLRQGEISGLQWKDFDEKTGTIHVVRSMQRDWKLKETKTSSSKRKIVLPLQTKKALLKQKTWQTEMKLLYSSEYEKSDFICTHEFGGPINPENLGKMFQKIIKLHDLPRIRFHDIRHTFATMLLKNEVNPKIVSEMLGHSNVQTTLDVYSHVLPDMQEEAARKLERELF